LISNIDFWPRLQTIDPFQYFALAIDFFQSWMLREAHAKFRSHALPPAHTCAKLRPLSYPSVGCSQVSFGVWGR